MTNNERIITLAKIRPQIKPDDTERSRFCNQTAPTKATDWTPQHKANQANRKLESSLTGEGILMSSNIRPIKMTGNTIPVIKNVAMNQYLRHIAKRGKNKALAKLQLIDFIRL